MTPGEKDKIIWCILHASRFRFVSSGGLNWTALRKKLKHTKDTCQDVWKEYMKLNGLTEIPPVNPLPDDNKYDFEEYLCGATTDGDDGQKRPQCAAGDAEGDVRDDASISTSHRTRDEANINDSERLIQDALHKGGGGFQANQYDSDEAVLATRPPHPPPNSNPEVSAALPVQQPSVLLVPTVQPSSSTDEDEEFIWATAEIVDGITAVRRQMEVLEEQREPLATGTLSGVIKQLSKLEEMGRKAKRYKPTKAP